MNLINKMVGNRFTDEVDYENIENKQRIVNNAPLSPSDCRFAQNPILDRKEALVKKILGQESLCLDPNDPKPKLLYLMAKSDPNHANLIKTEMSIDDYLDEYEDSTDPHSVQIYLALKASQKLANEGDQFAIDQLKAFEMNNREDASTDKLLINLNENYDLRFKIIQTNQQLCEEIAAAAKIGNLKSLIMQAHGSSLGVYIADKELLVQHPEDRGRIMGYNATGKNEREHILFDLNEKCFSGLDADGTITLLSCKTGEFKDSFASTVSKVSQRDVWATSDNTDLTRIELSSDIPTVPTFKSSDGTSDDACKFSPDGSMRCKKWDTEVSEVKNYAPALFLSIAVTYCFYKYVVKPFMR